MRRLDNVAHCLDASYETLARSRERGSVSDSILDHRSGTACLPNVLDRGTLASASRRRLCGPVAVHVGVHLLLARALRDIERRLLLSRRWPAPLDGEPMPPPAPAAAGATSPTADTPHRHRRARRQVEPTCRRRVPGGYGWSVSSTPRPSASTSASTSGNAREELRLEFGLGRGLRLRPLLFRDTSCDAACSMLHRLRQVGLLIPALTGLACSCRSATATRRGCDGGA